MLLSPEAMLAVKANSAISKFEAIRGGGLR